MRHTLRETILIWVWRCFFIDIWGTNKLADHFGSAAQNQTAWREEKRREEKKRLFLFTALRGKCCKIAGLYLPKKQKSHKQVASMTGWDTGASLHWKNSLFQCQKIKKIKKHKSIKIFNLLECLFSALITRWLGVLHILKHFVCQSVLC